MSSNLAVNYHDPVNLRMLGMAALKEKLGSVGAVYFIRQFSIGSGNYTVEREALHADLTFEEIVNGSMKMDTKRQV